VIRKAIAAGLAGLALSACAHDPVSGRQALGAVFRDCADCPEMILLAGGAFQMGDASGGDGDEAPVHAVTVKRFAAGRYEVTRDEYAVFARDTGHVSAGACFADLAGDGSWKQDALATWSNPGFKQSGRDPAVCVSWEDAKTYAGWLSVKTGKSYRLLSEAEWEYAARGGSTGAYLWGGDAGVHCAYANGADQTAKQKYMKWTTSACEDGWVQTAPAGSFPANGFGLHETTGNVWEWVADCYVAGYGVQPRDGGAHDNPDCTVRAARGGGYYFNPTSLRTANRASYAPTARGADTGFRIARTN
jgi:formylglycine-generating enzyme required for sulfatase activity